MKVEYYRHFYINDKGRAKCTGWISSTWQAYVNYRILNKKNVNELVRLYTEKKTFTLSKGKEQ